MPSEQVCRFGSMTARRMECGTNQWRFDQRQQVIVPSRRSCLSDHFRLTLAPFHDNTTQRGDPVFCG